MEPAFRLDRIGKVRHVLSDMAGNPLIEANIRRGASLPTTPLLSPDGESVGKIARTGRSLRLRVGEEIAARIRIAVFGGLFRRHEQWRARDGALLCELCIACLCGRFGKAEVKKFCYVELATAVGAENVRRFDVAVD